MDRLNGLAVFTQVAETRSFVAASRLLGVSASAVGKSVARLEARLGVRLFHRSTRSITLTAEGMLLLERSQRILHEIDDVEMELSQLKAAPRGKLRISLPIIGKLLFPALSDFMACYPAIELDLDFSDRLVDLVEEGFDAAVRTGEPADSRLVTRQLGGFRWLVVASPGYLAQHGVPIQPADLGEHACLHYKFPSTGKLEAWPLQGAAGDTPARLPVTLASNNVDALIHMALDGRGIACVPDFVVRDEVATGQLQTLLEPYLQRYGTFRIIWPSNRHIPPKLRVLIDFLGERLLPDARPS